MGEKEKKQKKDFAEFTKEVEARMQAEMRGRAEVYLETYQKNNGTWVHGLVVREPKTNVSPAFQLDPMYREYAEGRMTVEDCIEQIKHTYVEARRPEGIEIGEVDDFSQMRNKIMLMLVNKGKNKSRLADVPHVDFLDLSFMFYVMPGGDERTFLSLTVTDTMAKKWDVSAEQLMEIAMQNEQRENPIILKRLVDLFPDQSSLEGNAEYQSQLYVLKGSGEKFGATALFQPGVMERLHQLFEDDFYLIPSSVHEWLIIQDAKSQLWWEVNELIRSINGGPYIADWEVLSDHAYVYLHSERRIVY